MCSLLTAYSSFAFSAPNDPIPPSDSAPNAVMRTAPAVVATPSDYATLVTLTNNFQNDPLRPLSSAERTLLSQYAVNSMAPAYSGLSMDQRSSLARAVYLNASFFPRDTMTKFRDDQMLQLVGFTSRESSEFNAIIVRIREGGSLTRNDVLFIQRVEPKIGNFPAGLGLDLGKLTEYMSVNPALFTASDLSSFRGYCGAAAGLSLSDVQQLKAIADRNSTDIGMTDQRVLVKFGSSPLALNALDPESVAILGVVINDNTNMFPRGLVATFNGNLKDNQAIAIINARSGFNARKLQGPNAIKRNSDFSSNPNLDNRGSRVGEMPRGQRDLNAPSRPN